MNKSSIFYVITFIFIFAGVSVILAFLWLIEYDQQNYSNELNAKYSLIANARLLYFSGIISKKEFEEQTKNYKMNEITEAKNIRKVLFYGEVWGRAQTNSGLIEIISYNKEIYLNIIFDGKIFLYKDQDYESYRYFMIKAIAIAVICILI
ncbi:sensor histidine kinase, partial [Campylobacter novaezeelandiae]|nr:sensor histidine kinase [Campylobacter novaezeelandiae]